MAVKIFKTEHPKEMFFLALSEICQRFAVFGVGLLLVLYLVQHHNFSDASADHLYGIFTGVAFVLPIFGGMIADRTSYHKCAIIGACITSFGCFLMAIDQMSLTYIGLVLIALGGGLFTPSVYALLSMLYKGKHTLREAGFSIYYAAVNLGIFLALVLLGLFGQAKHWSIAFALAGCVQLIGLWPFLKATGGSLSNAASRHLTRASKSSKVPMHKREKDRIFVIVLISIISIIFWLSYNQGGSSMTLFALRYTDRTLFSSFTIPPSWLLSLENLFLVILAYPLSRLYIYLGKIKKDPSPIRKTAFGLLFLAVCFIIMWAGSLRINTHAESASVTPFVLVFAYFMMAVGEMFLGPIGLSLVTHLSPHKYTGFLVGVWYFCVGVAFYLGGLLAGLMSKVSSISNFFAIFAIPLLLVAIVLLLREKKINALRHMDSL